jgi:hypothetical protein
VLGDAWLFEVSSDTWTDLSSDSNSSLVPPPRHSHAAVYVWHEGSGRIFISGGIGRDHQPRDDVWMFDLTSRRWSEFCRLPRGMYVFSVCHHKSSEACKTHIRVNS